MKPNWQRFAPVGLYLALVAALAAAGFFIVQREFSLAIQISLGLVVFGLALFALLDPGRVRAALTGRQARYGSNALVLTIAFIGIIVVINYLVYKNPKRWDLTEGQQFSLSPETIDTLKRLPQPVKAIGFFTPRVSKADAEALLDQYKFHGEGNFDYEMINPDEDPLTARQYNLARDGIVILILGDAQEQVTLITEQELTGGLVRLLSPEKKMVYFLSGHGEFDPNGSGEQSYSTAKSALETKNYTVETLNLLAENAIPEDAQVIVIAGPIKPLAQQEVDLLQAYVMGGGSLIVMEEPLPVTQFGESPDPLAAYLSKNWGITLGDDMIVDMSSNQPLVAVANSYGDSIITEKMQGVVSFYPTARSVIANSNPSGASPVELVLTSPNSWAETDLNALTQNSQSQGQPQIAPDEGVDRLGPVPLAVSQEDATNRARLVVFGDAEFGSNNFFTQYGNGDMFVNSVDWAAEQENLISLTPKENIQRIMVPPGRYTMNLILLGSVFILPGIVLVAGVLVWVQRRRRG